MYNDDTYISSRLDRSCPTTKGAEQTMQRAMMIRVSFTDLTLARDIITDEDLMIQSVNLYPPVHTYSFGTPFYSKFQ